MPRWFWILIGLLFVAVFVGILPTSRLAEVYPVPSLILGVAVVVALSTLVVRKTRKYRRG